MHQVRLTLLYRPRRRELLAPCKNRPLPSNILDIGLQALEANHKLAIAELSEQIANRNTEIQKLSAEKDSVFSKGEKSYKVLQSLKVLNPIAIY